MTIFTCPSRGETGKFVCIAESFPNLWKHNILDVGCRSRKLKSALPQNVNYYGLDIRQPADILGNLNKNLPFHNQSFNTVVALDVLEHTDDIHHALSELCRVAKNHIIITLPNAYEITNRVKLLFGKKLSKYGLPPQKPDDRHRWFFSHWEAVQFIRQLSHQHQFQVIKEGCLVGPKRKKLLRCFFIARFPNLFSPCYVALLQRVRRART